MERIVQLKESEYNKLKKDAEMKYSEITRRAEEMYKEKGTYGINLELDCGNDYQEEIKFKAYSYVKDWNGQFPISETDKRRIVEFVNDRALEMMEKKFGRQISNINFCRNHIEHLHSWKYKFIGLTIFGWLAALGLVIVALLK